MTRHSDPQTLIWGSGDLTTWPEAKVIDRPTRAVERPVRTERATERARRSSTFGTTDAYCHVFVGSPPYRYTSCGLRLNLPVPVKQTHSAPPCPNGNTPCPDCVRVRSEDA
jgi:hypothetical protein